jgi:deoxyxylulose-5-phosphate synthase
MARADARLVGITPAMREASGLVKFSQQFPERYFDVGIADQHSVTFAAGSLAATAPRTRAPSISRICAACRTWS